MTSRCPICGLVLLTEHSQLRTIRRKSVAFETHVGKVVVVITVVFFISFYIMKEYEQILKLHLTSKNQSGC